MATTVTKTVKSAGGDYTSLSAAEAGEQRDLVAADEIAAIECHAFADTTAVTVAGWTTDATRYIRIYAAQSHGGVYSTSAYRLTTTFTANAFSGFMNVRQSYTRVEGLQFITTTDTGDHATRSLMLGDGAHVNPVGVRVSKCIFNHTFGGSAGRHLLLALDGAASGSPTAYIWNNLFYELAVAGYGGNNVCLGIYDRWTAWVYNNTFRTFPTGIGLSNGSYGGPQPVVTIKNNLFADGNASAGFDIGGSIAAAAGSDYNATTRSTLTYTVSGGGNTHDRVSQTFTFEDAANDDYRLASGDAGAKDFGVDLSADADLAFSDDIAGNTRSGSWDIGASEYTSSGTSIAVPVAALALAGAAPSLLINTIAAVGLGALSLAGVAPTAATNNVTRAMPAGALALSGSNVRVTFQGAETGALTLNGLAPTASVGTGGGTNTSIDVPAGGLSLAGAAPGVGQGVAAPPGAITLAGVAPSLSIDVRASTPAGALAFAGHAPVASSGLVGAMPTGTATLSGQAPSAFLGVAAAVPAGALALEGRTPNLGGQTLLKPAAGTVDLTGQAPTLRVAIAVDVPAGALAVTGRTPSLGGQAVADPSVGALQLEGLAPAVQQAITITVPAGALTTSGAALTVDRGVAIPTVALTLSGAAPVVQRAFAIAVPCGTLTLVGTVGDEEHISATNVVVTYVPTDLVTTTFVPSHDVIGTYVRAQTVIGTVE